MVSARLVGSSGYVCATDGEQSTVSLAAENLALIPEGNTAAARFWWGTSPEDVTEMRGRRQVTANPVPGAQPPGCNCLYAIPNTHNLTPLNLQLGLHCGVGRSIRTRSVRALM